MPVLSHKQAETLCMKMLLTTGLNHSDAAALLDTMMVPSLRGHDSHGIRLVMQMANRYLNNPRATSEKVEVVSESDATAVLDLKFGSGAVLAAVRATEMAIAKAEKCGISTIALKNVVGLASIGYFTELIVKRDMIGMMFTQSSHMVSPPWGGSTRLLGTSPIAVAIPARNEKPILIDMATTAIASRALGPLIQQVIGKGEQLPPGLILDDEGMPTTDPTKYQGQGTAGSMANMSNNAKGYSVQLLAEILGGLLTGGEPNYESPFAPGGGMVPGRRLTNGSLILAINVAFFTDVNTFKDRVDERIRMIKGSKKAKGFDEILLPGERGFKVEAKRRKEGIPFTDADWQSFIKAAQQLKVDVDEIMKTAA